MNCSSVRRIRKLDAARTTLRKPAQLRLRDTTVASIRQVSRLALAFEGPEVDITWRLSRVPIEATFQEQCKLRHR